MALDHGLFIIYGMAKLTNSFISILMTPFERSLSKLSENALKLNTRNSSYGS